MATIDHDHAHVTIIVIMSLYWC